MIVPGDSGRGITVVVHIIPAEAGDNIVFKVLMGGFQTVIHNGDDFIFRSLRDIPGRNNIDIFPDSAASLTGIFKMPLIIIRTPGDHRIHIEKHWG